MHPMAVNVAVIGAGTAGMVAYRAAKTHGKRVLLIEGGNYGTTCARVGCMPSKLLIAAAESAHAIERARDFGIHAAQVQINGAAVMARVRAERDRFVRFVLDGIDAIPPSERLHGYAQFIGPNSLRVSNDTEITAERIVIATGSSPRIPDVLAAAGPRLVTSDDIFEWTDLPASVAVIGTGVIGLEIGQALHRLGVRIAVFGRSKSLAQLTDPAVIDTAANCLGQELSLHFGVQLHDARFDGEQVTLQWRDAAGNRHAERYDYVLAATGRMPNLHRLGLEHAGIALDGDGVPLFDPATMQCGDKPIFIAGDASDELPVLHEAAAQGRLAGDNAARYPVVRGGSRHPAFSIAFTDPNIALVGKSYQQLKTMATVIGQASFENQGRSRAMRQNCGLLRLYADPANGRLLGAEMAGPRHEHLAHLLAWACQRQMTVLELLDMPFYHPVIEEGLRTALRDAKEKLLNGLPPIDHCTDCTPGV